MRINWNNLLIFYTSSIDTIHLSILQLNRLDVVLQEQAINSFVNQCTKNLKYIEKIMKSNSLQSIFCIKISNNQNITASTFLEYSLYEGFFILLQVLSGAR